LQIRCWQKMVSSNAAVSFHYFMGPQVVLVEIMLKRWQLLNR